MGVYRERVTAGWIAYVWHTDMCDHRHRSKEAAERCEREAIKRAGPGHLTPAVSDRGFTSMPALADAYENGAVRVLEASTADGPHIWLRVKDPNPGEHAVVMLTAKQAWRLKEQIEYLLEHHYQGDARPTGEAAR